LDDAAIDALIASTEAAAMARQTLTNTDDALTNTDDARPTSEGSDEPTGGSDEPTGNKKPRQLPITLVYDSDLSIEERFSQKNKNPAPAAPVAQLTSTSAKYDKTH